MIFICYYINLKTKRSILLYENSSLSMIKAYNEITVAFAAVVCLAL